MKEVTRMITARMTVIGKTDERRKITENGMREAAKLIRDAIGFDHVEIINVQDFVNDKEEETEEEPQITIEDAMRAYEILREVKAEIANMESEAGKHYIEANKAHDAYDVRKSKSERDIGNALMEHVINLKLLIRQGE